MFSFTNSKETGHKTGGNLIPGGSLTRVLVTVRGIKHSSTTGGEYADLELTCFQGPWEGRKIFTNIMNFQDERNSEAARNMGFGAILHMMEAAQLVNIADLNSYAPLNTMQFQQMVAALDNRVVAIKVSIKKDKEGSYPDKNQVGEWLTPNAARGEPAKLWQALAEGRTSMKPAPQTAPAAQFGAPQGQPAGAPAPQAPAFAQAQRPAPAPAFGAQQPAQQFVPPQQPQGFAPAPAQLQQPAPQAPVPGTTPAWLQNGQGVATPDKAPF